MALPALSVNAADCADPRRRDTESEVRQRFNYWEKDFPYSVADPVYTLVYTEAQKQAQRDAAKSMIAALTAAAADTKGTRAFTIPAGIYRVEPGQIQLQDVSNFEIHAPGVEVIVDSEKSGVAFSFVSCTKITLGSGSLPHCSICLNELW